MFCEIAGSRLCACGRPIHSCCRWPIRGSVRGGQLRSVESERSRSWRPESETTNRCNKTLALLTGSRSLDLLGEYHQNHDTTVTGTMKERTRKNVLWNSSVIQSSNYSAAAEIRENCIISKSLWVSTDPNAV